MKRTVRLLSVLIATLLILSACSTAEEAGQETGSEGGAPAVSSEPAVTVTEPESELASEPSLDVSEPETDPGDTAGTDAGSLLEMAEENPQLSQLVAAIEAAGLRERLEQIGTVTIFAPNNDAFASLGQSDLAALLANPQELDDILRHHVVEGGHPASQLSDGQTLSTLEGGQLTVSVDGDTIMVDGVEVVQPDAATSERGGAIHIIDEVLRP
jgi:uncharacterized surface protein with fasciclin (FAS1) repeats